MEEQPKWQPLGSPSNDGGATVPPPTQMASPLDVPAPIAETVATRRSSGGRRVNEKQRKKRRRARRLKSAFIMLIVLGLVVAAGYGAWKLLPRLGLFSDDEKDYPGPGTGSVTIEVAEGATGTDIGNVLKEKDVVASVKAFIIAFDANADSSRIQPGTYELKKQMKAADAVAALLDTSTRTDIRLTVVEGDTVKQITEKLVKTGGYSAQEVQDALADVTALGLPEHSGANVEGWLAPATYSLAQKDSVQAVLKEMVALTIKRLDSLNVPQEQREMVLTKASLVEREVNIDEYYPMVARVIENRLKDVTGATRGLLQLDSAVLYGLGKIGGIPTRAEVTDPNNLYNTYVHAGLPPGPIGAPSITAIKAVLNPAEGTWLYFVTVNLTTGETKFANTLAEHDQYVAELRESCKTTPNSGCNPE